MNYKHPKPFDKEIWYYGILYVQWWLYILALWMFYVLLMSVGVDIATAKGTRLTCVEKQIMGVIY